MRLRFALALLSLVSAAFGQAVDTPQPTGEVFARTFPYSMIGKLVFSQGVEWFQGSGTIIRSNSVLTAAHNLWDADRGFSTDILFRRSLYGTSSAGDTLASRVYVLSGYRDKARSYSATDPRSFSEDLGAVIFANPVASGAAAGWWANPVIFASGQSLLGLGYGAETHDGTELLSVASKGVFEQVSGAFYDSYSLTFEGGMSGGPVFARNANGDLFVSGIVVAGTAQHDVGGIRIIDAAAAAFIRTYMR